mgnify:CR=1 FL=1
MACGDYAAINSTGFNIKDILDTFINVNQSSTPGKVKEKSEDKVKEKSQEKKKEAVIEDQPVAVVDK